MNYDQRVAIVTGASSGIGLAITRMFVARNVRVAMVARTASKLEALAEELGRGYAVAFPLDVTDRAGLLALPARVADHFGRLDFVINNAGVNHRGDVHEQTPEDIVSIIETNLVAPTLLTRAALDRIDGEGVIVNVASLAGKIPVPHEATYSATKAGLRAFGSALSVELRLAQSHVRITTVNPGPVDTGFFGDDLDHVPDIVFSQPMSSAEDVARAVFRAIDEGVTEVDVPAPSGKLATLGYLSPTLYNSLRPSLEKLGARNKKKFIAEKAKLSKS